MVFEGGQLGILLAYTTAPLVIASFIKTFKERENLIQNIILSGLALSLETLFDVRMVYVTLVAVGLFWVVKVAGNLFVKTFNTKSLFIDIISVVIPVIITVLIHAFWILPTVLFGGAQSSIEAYIPTSQALHFFSFAKLENSLSLLQPNWPENIFGKVSFMKPQFILIPVIAFASFLFIEKFKEYKKYILSFAAISFVGVFLAKGINSPFGNVYEFLFNHLPGFSLFRDPTKWYLLTALGYSVLIPFSIFGLSNLVSRKLKLQKSLVILFVIFWLVTIYPVINYRVGTFTLHKVPNEYVKLKNFLDEDKSFSRTLWLPSHQRYGYSAPLHPAVSAVDFYHVSDLKKLNRKIEDQKNEKLLQDSSIRYVIIPLDTDDEIFLEDRKYDAKKYQATLHVLKKVDYLGKIRQFGDIAVFEVKDSLPHLYVLGQDGPLKNVDFSRQNQTEYRVNIKDAKANDRLIFVEAFDKNWEALNGAKKENSKEYMRFNSFPLSEGSSSLFISFTPQRYVFIGSIISSSTLIAALGSLVYLKVKKRS